VEVGKVNIINVYTRGKLLLNVCP